MKYILLVSVALAMGFTTNCIVSSLQRGYFFAFGVHLAFEIYWILKLVDLTFNW